MKPTISLLASSIALLFAQEGTARTILGDCSLAVGGRTYLDVKKTCRIEMDADGSFSVGTGANRRQPYFGYLTTNGDGSATAYWNETPSSTHAHTPLGDDFRRQGSCWVGSKARICALKR